MEKRGNYIDMLVLLWHVGLYRAVLLCTHAATQRPGSSNIVGAGLAPAIRGNTHALHSDHSFCTGKRRVDCADNWKFSQRCFALIVILANAIAAGGFTASAGIC